MRIPNDNIHVQAREYIFQELYLNQLGYAQQILIQMIRAKNKDEWQVFYNSARWNILPDYLFQDEGIINLWCQNLVLSFPVEDYIYQIERQTLILTLMDRKCSPSKLQYNSELLDLLIVLIASLDSDLSTIALKLLVRLPGVEVKIVEEDPELPS